MWLAIAALPIITAQPAPVLRPAQLLWRAADHFKQAAISGAAAARQLSVRIAGATRRTIFLHPKNRGRAVASFPEITINCPFDAMLFLITYAGLPENIVWNHPRFKPDGVRFYVAIDNRVRARAWLRESKWQLLVAPAGQAKAGQPRRLKIALATDAGPAGNSAYDWGHFGDPILIAVPSQPLPPGQPIAGTMGIALWRGGPQDATIIPIAQTGQQLCAAPDSVVKTSANGWAVAWFDFASHGPAEAVAWTVQPAAPSLQVWGGSFQPRCSIASAATARAVLLAGERPRLRVRIENSGPGALVPANSLIIQCAGQRRRIENLPPGKSTTAEFLLPPLSPGTHQFAVSASLKIDGTERMVRKVTLSAWPKPPRLPSRPDKPFVRTSARFAMLGDSQTLWLIHPASPGLSALIYAWQDGWRLVGSAAPLVQAVRSDGSDIALRLVRITASSQPVPSLAAELASREGLRVRLLCRPGQPIPGSVAISLRATSSRPIALGSLRSPALHPGDRSTGTRKALALFPGLEFLYGDERSSSTRDLAPPLNERWVPHKFKITVPLMAVEISDRGPVMALIWDPRQKWDGQHIAPAACFASPDFLFDRDSHLLQLMLPSVPDYIPENRLLSPDGFTLQPGQRLELSCFAFAAVPKPDATGVFQWFDRTIGFPEPEKWPRSFEDEIALCRHGFLVTVWDPETQAHRHCVGWGPADSPGFATLMLMDARAVARGLARDQLLQRVELIANKILRARGPAGLTSRANCHIMAWEFPYHWGGLPAALRGMRAEAEAAIRSQEDDGLWGYYPDQRRRQLGKPGTRVIGICAQRAYFLAKWLAISGDSRAEAALHRALKAMDRFRIPRGAQGWECPILEPDVLAAAYAVRAYTWAYMALGDPALLDRARYWARTGLAFQYAWDDGQHPGMRYASIPVFGSTFFRHSWIGLPVQWCGLVYAYALQELMRFDNNPLWRKQAEGITVSAMYQQWPMDNKQLAGSYPDSFGNWFTRRNPAFINPENIMVNTLALHGLDPGLRSSRVSLPGGTVHVTAPCDFTAIPSPNGLTIRLKYLPSQPVYLTIAPVQLGQPSISADGQALGRCELLNAGQQGWAYDSELQALAAGVRCGPDGQATITVSGISPATR